MTNITFLSRLMKMSWEIQRSKHHSCSKALQAAWAICSNEDVTVFYLVKKLHGGKPIPRNAEKPFGLFKVQ